MTIPSGSRGVFEPDDIQTVWQVYQRLLEHKRHWPAEFEPYHLAKLVLTSYADATGDVEALLRRCLERLDRHVAG